MVNSQYIYIILLLTSLACKNNNKINNEVFGKLETNTAFVDIKIGDKLFYSEESIFVPTITMAEKYIAINLVDQKGGNLQLQISRPNWTKNITAPFKISPTTVPGYIDYGTFLIGKRDAQSMEGYILSKGNFKWLKLSKEEAVLNCEGLVVRPQDAFIEENEIPFKGLIYFKEPIIDFVKVNEEQIFN